MEVHRSKTRPVERRSHFHLPINTLLSQDGHPWPHPRSNHWCRDIFVAVVSQGCRQTPIGLLYRLKFCIGASCIVSEPGDGMTGLTPQALQCRSPAVDQFKLAGIDYDTLIQPWLAHETHRALEARLRGQRHHFRHLFIIHLNKCSDLFRK